MRCDKAALSNGCKAHRRYRSSDEPRWAQPRINAVGLRRCLRGGHWRPGHRRSGHRGRGGAGLNAGKLFAVQLCCRVAGRRGFSRHFRMMGMHGVRVPDRVMMMDRLRRQLSAGAGAGAPPFSLDGLAGCAQTGAAITSAAVTAMPHRRCFISGPL